MNKEVLLKRNSTLYASRGDALSEVAKVVSEIGVDGCQILFRYSEGSRIKTMLAVVASDGNYSLFEEENVSDYMTRKEVDDLYNKYASENKDGKTTV